MSQGLTTKAKGFLREPVRGGAAPVAPCRRLRVPRSAPTARTFSRPPEASPKRATPRQHEGGRLLIEAGNLSSFRASGGKVTKMTDEHLDLLRRTNLAGDDGNHQQGEERCTVRVLPPRIAPQP